MRTADYEACPVVASALSTSVAEGSRNDKATREAALSTRRECYLPEAGRDSGPLFEEAAE
jgi:hypothetical protein